MAIAVTCVNAYLLRSRAAAEIARNPELKEGYDQLFKWYLIYLNLPWLVMGIGILIGGTHSVFDYFDPRAGNPYVIAFHITIIILWALIIFWIYFADGAEFLVRYTGVMNIDIKSTIVLKLLVALMFIGGILVEIAMWSRRLPVLNPSP